MGRRPARLGLPSDGHQRSFFTRRLIARSPRHRGVLGAHDAALAPSVRRSDGGADPARRARDRDRAGRSLSRRRTPRLRDVRTLGDRDRGRARSVPGGALQCLDRRRADAGCGSPAPDDDRRDGAGAGAGRARSLGEVRLPRPSQRDRPRRGGGGRGAAVAHPRRKARRSRGLVRAADQRHHDPALPGSGARGRAPLAPHRQGVRATPRNERPLVHDRPDELQPARTCRISLPGPGAALGCEPRPA